MNIAQQKRKENIAEYIIYLWQLEDMLRAMKFSAEQIYLKLVEPRGLSKESEEEYLVWYMDIVNLLREENKEKVGHLDHTLHLIADLHNLHLQLLTLPVGKHYAELFKTLEPHLLTLRTALQRHDVSDTELCFRAVYAALLYKIKGINNHSVTDTVELVSPVLAELARIYMAAERGEIDLYNMDDDAL
ncbi:MAG: DUF4924 family protein [Alistipes sp.]|nr:DUF4924 family protein [Candidatus Alistipes equi]